jgi:hypothetical protein
MVSRTVTQEVPTMALVGGGSLGCGGVDQLPWFPYRRRKCRGNGVDVGALLNSGPTWAQRSGSGTMISGSPSEHRGGGGAERLWWHIPRWWFAGAATELRQGGGVVGVEYDLWSSSVDLLLAAVVRGVEIWVVAARGRVGVACVWWGSTWLG